MKRILIIKPSSMGDVVHAMPAVHALLASDPGLTADWLIKPAYAELLDYVPGIGRRILFRPPWRELIRELRKECYDAIIDLQGLFRSALAGLAAKGPLYGPARSRELPARFCYRHRLHYPDGTRHAIEKICAMIREFSGLAQVPPYYRLPVAEDFSRRAGELLDEAGLAGRPFIAIAPGTRWTTKQWPPEFFAECAGLIASEHPDRRFVLLGSPAEVDLCRRVREHAANVPMADLAGRSSPGVLTEIIRRADLLLCNDSGPMHLAAAAGTPVTALFGPTDPSLTGPYGSNCRVIRPELDCIGCLRKSCASEKCHQAVSPRRVADTVTEQLKERMGQK
ncbi:MAG: glycosyltransferase family 9 protein [Lentisphaeria bacterium]|nr:glycosyltransferase family 9 protein [Lentisphaeria bacterium]